MKVAYGGLNKSNLFLLHQTQMINIKMIKKLYVLSLKK